MTAPDGSFAFYDEYDPYVHDRDPDEPPELEEDDCDDDSIAMSMWDPIEGCLDA